MPELKPASPPLPWRVWLQIKLLSAATDFAVRKDGTLNRRFMEFVDAKSPADVKPFKGVSTTDVIIDPSINLWFRVFIPVPSATAGDGEKLPIIVFFHGGGFSFLSSASKPYDFACRRFARKIPAVVISVNYRLSPENRFPAPYDDGERVLKWIAANSSGCLPETADLSRCFLAGDSAGANIAHHVGCRYATAVEDFRPVSVIGIIAIQPFFGGEERLASETRLKNAPIVSVDRTDRQWKWFLPEGSDRNHPAANVFGPNASDISELADFPATLVFIGGFDPLQDWQRRYHEGLKRSGKVAELVEYADAIHAFYIFPDFPTASMLISEIKAFIEKRVR